MKKQRSNDRSPLSMHGLSPEDALRAVLAGRNGQPIPPPPAHKKRKGRTGKRKAGTKSKP